MFESFITETFLVVLLFSGIPLVVSSFSGLIVAIIQSATQIQEQSISYVVKLASVIGVLVLMSGWIARDLCEFTQELLKSIAHLGRM